MFSLSNLCPIKFLDSANRRVTNITLVKIARNQRAVDLKGEGSGEEVE